MGDLEGNVHEGGLTLGVCGCCEENNKVGQSGVRVEWKIMIVSASEGNRRDLLVRVYSENSTSSASIEESSIKRSLEARHP